MTNTKEYKREWYEKNKERIRAKTRAANNTPARKEYMRAYREANKERMNAQARERSKEPENRAKRRPRYAAYRAAHPELYRAASRKSFAKAYADEEKRKKMRAANNVATMKNYSEHKDKWLERGNRWRANNRERYNATTRARRAAGYGEIEKQHAKRRRLANPEPFREAYRRRRALHYCAAGHHTKEQWLARVEYYGWRCFYCDRELSSKTLTQDHRIPLVLGGAEWPANLVPSCKPCNSGKGARKHYKGK